MPPFLLRSNAIWRPVKRCVMVFSDYSLFKHRINLRDRKTVERLKTAISLSRKQKIGVICGFGVGSVCFVWYEIETLDQKLRVINNVYENERENNYIIPPEPLKLGYDDIFPKSKRRRLRYNVEKSLHKILPWFQSKTEDPALLLKLTESSDPDIRHMGLVALTAKNNWKDHQFRKVAQACSNRTMVSLARFAGSDYRLFRPMPWLPPPKASVGVEFHALLELLVKEGVDGRIKEYTTKVMLETRPKNIVESGNWLFVDTPLMKTNETVDGLVEVFLLQALVHHTAVISQCVKIASSDGLLLLQRVYLQYPHSLVIRRLLAHILANLTMETSLHDRIIEGGWVAVLHRWMETTDTALFFHAARALANLDRDRESDTGLTAQYDDGMFLAHPVHRSRDKKQKIKTDIVFIHGLLGGPFKTWRQEDKRFTVPDFEITDEVRSAHTFFWPKDWLAHDLSNVRVLNVGYETELTMWNNNLPIEGDKRTLKERGASLIKRLEKADVGSRPVIWVGHSMGGLLIKEIMEVASKDPVLKNLVDNTVGVVFYSTPHRGASLAKYSNMARYMIFPSIEVQELNKDNPKLKTLQESFLQIVNEKNIPCLSFGELEKTSIGMKLKLDIVPPESSNVGVGEFHAMPCNHINICKPRDQNSDLYKLTLAFIRKCIFHDKLQRKLPSQISEAVHKMSS